MGVKEGNWVISNEFSVTVDWEFLVAEAEVVELRGSSVSGEIRDRGVMVGTLAGLVG